MKIKRLIYLSLLTAAMILSLSRCGNEEVESDSDTETETFTDSRDGKKYRIVTIGDQIWMAENLKYLPSVVGANTSSNTIPYYYVYDYDGTNLSDAKATNNYKTYGVLYNWQAARTACPSGWHLPSDAEWTQLANYLGGATVAGGKLKEEGTTHWLSPNTGATNESGFTGLPGGLGGGGGFSLKGSFGYWWSNTEEFTTLSYFRHLNYSTNVIFRGTNNKNSGLSVCCVKD